MGNGHTGTRFIAEPEQNFMLGMIHEGNMAVSWLLKRWDSRLASVPLDEILNGKEHEQVAEALACFAWLNNWHGCAETDAEWGLWLDDWVGCFHLDTEYVANHFRNEWKKHSTHLVEDFEEGCYVAVPRPQAFHWVRRAAMNFAR